LSFNGLLPEPLLLDPEEAGVLLRDLEAGVLLCDPAEAGVPPVLLLVALLVDGVSGFFLARTFKNRAFIRES
jgi:hypothetical protein